MKRLHMLWLGILFLISNIPFPIYAEENDIQTNIYPYVEENAPTVTSSTVFLYDADQNQILLNRHGDEQMFPASLTKMMTEILAIENLKDLNQTVTITPKMWEGLLEANASVAGFEEGSVVTVRDLLYGCALPSGADAVQALVMTVSGDMAAFVELMNQKAQEIGMQHTHFSNPTGLHAEDHYSTAHDMAILLQYCLQNETFKELIGTSSYVTTNGLVLESTVWSKINGEIPGLIGGKTGYTLQAGRCLASAADFNGMHLILVTGGSEGDGHIRDAETLYRWYSDHYERKTVMESHMQLADIPILDTWPGKNMTVFNPEAVMMDLPKNADIQIKPQVADHLYAPIAKGAQVGSLTITADEQVIYTTGLYADDTIHRNIFAYVWRRLKEHSLLSMLAAGCIAVLLGLLRRKRIRMRHRRHRPRRRKEGY